MMARYVFAFMALVMMVFLSACQGPPGPQGEKGEPGSLGIAPTEEKLLTLIRQVVAERAEELRGLKGEQGPQGERGMQGPVGPQGPPSSRDDAVLSSIAQDIARVKDKLGVPYMVAEDPNFKIGGIPFSDDLYRTVNVTPGDVLAILGMGFQPNELMALEEEDRTIGGQRVWVEVQTLKATNGGWLDTQVSITQRHLAITRIGDYDRPYFIRVVRQNGTKIYPTNEIRVKGKVVTNP